MPMFAHSVMAYKRPAYSAMGLLRAAVNIVMGKCTPAAAGSIEHVEVIIE